jgi:ribose 1,5-bisphosphokinase PhnN
VFVTKETFEARKDERFFLETASPLNMPYEYGLPRVTHNNLDAVPTVLLRAMVMDLLGKHYTNYLVYQIESPRDIVAERLKQRGTSIEDIDNRLALYDREVTAGRTMADRVFHNDSSFESLKTSFLTALREDFLE